MLQRRIAEARDKLCGVVGQTDAGDAQRRGLFVQHQPQGGAAVVLIRHALVDIAVAARNRGKPERMAAVQHAQLHVFKRQYIADQLDASLLPRRASGGKVVFHHPLDEGLAGDGAFVAHAAQRGGDLIQRGRRGGRHDAIHHGAGEGGGGGDPVGERRIPRLRQIEHRPAQHVAVLRNIVTGEQGEGGQAAFAPQPQRFHQNAGHGLRLMRHARSATIPECCRSSRPLPGSMQ